MTENEKLIRAIKNRKQTVKVEPQINVQVPEIKAPKIEFPVVLNVPKITIPPDLMDGLKQDLQDIVSAIKSEMGKEINFPEMPVQDNTDIIEALKLIEDKIKEAEYPEMVDYSKILKEISSKIKLTDTSKIEKLLTEIRDAEPDEKSIFDEVSSKKPLPIMIIGKKGEHITSFGGHDTTAPSIVGLKSNAIHPTQINPAVDSFGIGDFDRIDLTYSGSNISTAVYKLKGVVVATLTLSYTGSNLTSVVRT